MHDIQGRRCERGVAGGGPRALVAEPCLHDPQPHPPFQQMGRIGVPQRMDGGVFGHATLALPVLPPSRQHPRGERHAAVFAPFALLHSYQPPVCVDVGDLQLCALGQAQPTGLDDPQTHPGFRVLDQGQEGPDLPQTHHAGPLLDVSGSNEVEDGPRSLQRAPVEEPDPREVNTEGTLRDLRVAYNPSQTVATHRKIEYSSVEGKMTRQAERWWARSQSYRAAV